MVILFNALSARQGGGQTYVINLLKSFPRRLDAKIYLLSPNSLPLPANREDLKRIIVKWPVENPFTRAIWEWICLPSLLRRLKADVLFCPGGIIGATVPQGCKSVTMFRNMIPFDYAQRKKYPLGYMRLRNWLLRRVMARSMARADCVICVSEFARQVIEQKLPGLPGKITVIPHGINPIFRAKHQPRPAWLPARRYILYVSILDVYKAQLQVVRAYASLKSRRPTSEMLILTGPTHLKYAQTVRAEIERLKLQNDVLLTGPIPYHDLPSLYHHSLINIFASECENCPNIMLEALASGRPLLASSRPPMPEFGGDAALYFDPSCPEQLAEKLRLIIDDPVRMNQLSRQVVQRAQLYDWSKVAETTWNVIQNCG